MFACIRMQKTSRNWAFSNGKWHVCLTKRPEMKVISGTSDFSAHTPRRYTQIARQSFNALQTVSTTKKKKKVTGMKRGSPNDTIIHLCLEGKTPI